MKKQFFILLVLLSSLTCGKEGSTENTPQFNVSFSASDGGTVDKTGGE